MIMLENSGAYKFAKGYYDLAIEKLYSIIINTDWVETWDNESHSKSKNYQEDLNRQLKLLQQLQLVARD